MIAILNITLSHNLNHFFERNTSIVVFNPEIKIQLCLIHPSDRYAVPVESSNVTKITSINNIACLL